ncbi:MAG: ECF transporter S component [Erysipelotrichaceae bacterium]|nr:ECF transporter S component [Erysipelotrichaceae bacterium]MBR6957669.1 ECF transporter S component [Erysipelotrichaceae bacterium]
MTTRKLTTLAMLTSIYVVLSILTPIKVINFKFTLEAFPILVAGLLMGPIEGLIVGFTGSAIYQIFLSSYGITATTPLWILPHAVNGLLAGLLGRTVKQLTTINVISIASICAFTVTALNTLALYVDSKLFGYYSNKLVFGALRIKIATGFILAVIYALILPKLITQLKKLLKK